MSHIVIDARIINSSTGRYVERLLTHLQDIDTTNRYTILVPSKDLAFWKPTASNFTVIAVDFPNYSIAEQLPFRSFLENLKPDLVHFCMPQQPAWYKGKTVTTFHDLTLLKTYNSDKNWLVYHLKQFVGRFLFARVAKKSDAIICPSDYTKQELLDYFPVDAKKIHRIYESAEVQITTPAKYKHPFTQFILYVGQQSDYKNIRRLGDAHQKLLEKHPDLGLILVGKKKADTLKNEAYFNSKGYKNILFTDFIPDEQRDYLYDTCAAYVFPSLMEGFGLPGLEAMVYGAPVVSSNATCLPEVYGDAAHYFNPTSVDDIATAIDDIISDEKLANTLTKNGKKQLKKYSWARMARKTHEVYMSVLNK